MSHLIYIVDDEEAIRLSLGAILQDEGYTVKGVESGIKTLEMMRAGEKPDIIILDIWMPELDGIETLKQIKSEFPDQMILMMSGHGTIETAVKATKLGAFDFIEKPPSIERVLVLLQNVLSVQDLSRENQALRAHVQKTHVLVGNSKVIGQIRELVRRVAPTMGTVLISGENGTGKEIIAHMVHGLSLRYGSPFVEVNCAAIPEDLIESELFGHEKGAFTGATQMRRGKFDLANGGTLFLDEIGDMSLKTQAKILRILQEQRFERVGGSQLYTVDVRIVVATNKDLKTEIQKGNFREDLYYRLNVIPIKVPALRERAEDISVLAVHFMKEFSTMYAKAERTLAPEAVKMMIAYTWPGNVRELKNLIERIVILTQEPEAGKPVTAETLLRHFADERALSKGETENTQELTVSKNLKDARQEFEKDYILRILKENDGNISKAAAALGIERSHLHRKIKSYGIEVT